jgi:ribosomal protein S18 acetylase RimI-like enzyme
VLVIIVGTLHSPFYFKLDFGNPRGTMERMDMSCRQLLKTDEPALRALVGTVHAGLKDSAYFYKYTDAEYADMWRKDYVIDVFDNITKLIGFSLLVIEPEFCDMDGVMVLSEYRRRGIATDMNNRLIEHAKKIKSPKITICIHPENQEMSVGRKAWGLCGKGQACRPLKNGALFSS